jgi:energy-converting hydrogenase Eha subunit E
VDTIARSPVRLDEFRQLRSAFGAGSLAVVLSFATGAGVGVTDELVSLDGAGPLWVPCEPSVGACIEGSCAAAFCVSAGAITVVFGAAGAVLVLGSRGAADVSLEVLGYAGVSLVVWAYTRPTAPTMVVAAIAVARVLETFIVNLLGEERAI